MQIGGEKMVKIPKLVYVLILFLSIFLSIIVSNSSFSSTFVGSCKRDKDCPKIHGANIRCRKGNCVPI